MGIEKQKGISRNKQTVCIQLYVGRSKEGMLQILFHFSASRERGNSAPSSSSEIWETDFVTVPTLTFGPKSARYINTGFLNRITSLVPQSFDLKLKPLC